MTLRQTLLVRMALMQARATTRLTRTDMQAELVFRALMAQPSLRLYLRQFHLEMALRFWTLTANLLLKLATRLLPKSKPPIP